MNLVGGVSALSSGNISTARTLFNYIAVVASSGEASARFAFQRGFVAI